MLSSCEPRRYTRPRSAPPSSSAIHAVAAPLVNVAPSPQTSWASSVAQNAASQPSRAKPIPMRATPITTESRRL